MKTYQQKKEEARNLAIFWQHDAGLVHYSWEGIMTCYEFFEKLGRRYGLLREFRENGII